MSREQHERTWNRQERPVRESEATFTLDRQIAEAKAEIGSERWAELNAEWDARSALRDGEV